MWLLDTSTLQLKAVSSMALESYAILSHTWDTDEITFAEIQRPTETVMQKCGYQKVRSFCNWAQTHKFAYAWVDTCCIDKSSSAELSEAINSMFNWYHNAKLCVVHLSDVPAARQADSSFVDVQKQKFSDSRWFTRGFTLQELVAPRKRIFLANDWSPIDDSHWHESILDTVSKVTNIRRKILNNRNELWNTCVAERMSWAAHRKTTRLEDCAYSLMGMFQVNMAILYGEGLNSAFRRLQHEILKTSFDQTLFAWRSHQQSGGLLATSPASFVDTPELGLWAPEMLAPTTATNIGILIRACVVGDASADVIRAVLQCDVMTSEGWMCLILHLKRVEIVVCVVNGKRHKAYRRVSCDTWWTLSSDDLDKDNRYEDILVLEDDSHHLVVNAWRQHDARWSNGTFGRTPMTLKLEKRPAPKTT